MSDENTKQKGDKIGSIIWHNAEVFINLQYIYSKVKLIIPLKPMKGRIFLMSLAMAALPAFGLMHCYNGRLGRQSRAMRLLFYWYYPLHLLVFGLAGRLA